MTKPNLTFENLDSWNAAKTLTLRIYQLTKSNRFGKDFDFIRQLRRASISVMNYIAEGFHRFHSKETIRFFDISHSSCQEVKSMILIGKELGYLSEAEKCELVQFSTNVIKLTKGFIRYLINKDNSMTP